MGRRAQNLGCAWRALPSQSRPQRSCRLRLDFESFLPLPDFLQRLFDRAVRFVFEFLIANQPTQVALICLGVQPRKTVLSIKT